MSKLRADYAACRFRKRLIPERSKTLVLVAVALLFSCQLGFAADPVPLYGIFEVGVTNNNSYSNPFDFEEVGLQGKFTSPSGVMTSFFGFYDGDGAGGQEGNVCKRLGNYGIDPTLLSLPFLNSAAAV